MKTKLLGLILIILFTSCREEFFFESSKHVKNLVVEGMVTNEAPPYIVKLSHSSRVDIASPIPLSNYKVYLIDNLGNNEQLFETEIGTYESLGLIQGTVGNSYMLQIVSPDGEEYETEFQELLEPIGIDSIYTKSDIIPQLNNPLGIYGLQFFIDSEPLDQNETNLLWKLTETYQYEIDRKLEYVQTRFGDHITYNPRYDTLEVCWKTQKINEVFAATTSNLNSNSIKQHPIHFIGTDSKRISIRYSVLVSQYNISKEAYEFWKGIEKQNSNDNFLISSQPSNLVSNVFNTNNSDELVLGFFTVGSITQKRIFVNKPEVPFFIPKCVVISDAASIREYKRNHGPPYFYVQDDNGYYGITDRECIDCRNEGGSIYPPSFWIE